MKRFLMLLTISLTCLALLSPVAEAKRFGGGSSFGKQRATPSQAQKTPTTVPGPSTPAPAAPSGNKWLGPLAGLALGAGLGAMFSGSGLSGVIGPILLALLAAGGVMFLISRFSKPQQPMMQYAGSSRSDPPPDPLQQPIYGGGVASVSQPAKGNVPTDFPVEAFLRNGKMSFIRLQAANDRKDLDDIREYTTPEMFAEISMQIQERGDAAQKTDVISINAELLEVASEGDYSIASVRFAGTLSENNGLPEKVDEVWHVQKNQRDNKSVWLLAGIQQIN